MGMKVFTMPINREKNISEQIIEKAKAFGACLAGIADVEALKESPSHIIFGKLEEYKGVGTKKNDKTRTGKIAWPENAKSAIIVAVEHPEEKPELDWWKEGYTGGTAGNRVLMDINNRLAEWLKEEKGIQTKKLTYHIETGGIFLKDAAVMAGLGCIGENNMLVTPEFGPRVRLRAMLTDETLLSTGPVDFDPCEECHMLCRKDCPQEAFQKKMYSMKEFGLEKLPAKTGLYNRHLCNVQMESDVNNGEKIKAEGQSGSIKRVRFCRICEWSCPVGKTK